MFYTSSNSFFFSFAAVTVVLQPPQFAIVGGTFSLTCTVQQITNGATVQEFKWYHNQTEITAEQRNTRFNIRQSGNVSSILSTTASGRQDGGEYHCQVYVSGNINPVNSTRHMIRVRGIMSTLLIQLSARVVLIHSCCQQYYSNSNWQGKMHVLL